MNEPGTISAKVFYTIHTFRAQHSKLVIFCDRTVYEQFKVSNIVFLCYNLHNFKNFQYLLKKYPVYWKSFRQLISFSVR